jgi:hypothetical protein
MRGLMRADSPIFCQKESGAYFTPSDVARALVSWALRRPRHVALGARSALVSPRDRWSRFWKCLHPPHADLPCRKSTNVL